jgi:hypothetical protein
VSARMGRRPKIDEAGLAVIRERHAAGVCDAAVAAELGVGEWVVSYWRREMGLPSNRRLRFEARLAAVAAAARRHGSRKRLARDLGIDVSSVTYLRAKLGREARS